jgi:hypothetical protein
MPPHMAMQCVEPSSPTRKAETKVTSTGISKRTETQGVPGRKTAEASRGACNDPTSRQSAVDT